MKSLKDVHSLSCNIVNLVSHSLHIMSGTKLRCRSKQKYIRSVSFKNKSNKIGQHPQDREVFNEEESLYDSSLFVENEVKRKIEHFTKERKMLVEKPYNSQVDVWKK